jgi:hypothetical protein
MLDTVAGFRPSRSAAPPANSRQASTSPREEMVLRENGSVQASIRCTTPSARMNTMSSGMWVFSIHMPTSRGRS